MISGAQKVHDMPPVTSLLFNAESEMHAMYKTHMVAPVTTAVGIESVGGAFYPIIHAGTRRPTGGREIFTTVHENQARQNG